MGAGLNPEKENRPSTHNEDVSTEGIFRSEFLQRQRQARKAKYKQDVLEKQADDYILTGRRAGGTHMDPDAAFFTFSNVTAYCICVIGTFASSSSVLMGPTAYNLAMNPIMSVDGRDEVGGYMLMLFLWIACSFCLIGMTVSALFELSAREQSAWEQGTPIDITIDHRPSFRFSLFLFLLSILFVIYALVTTMRGSVILVSFAAMIGSFGLLAEMRRRYLFAKDYNLSLSGSSKAP